METGAVAPPVTYENWLNCFDLLKSSLSYNSEIVEIIKKGSFTNTGYIAGQFNNKLADAITEMLNKRISRFVKDLNMLIAFNELSDIVPLFAKLRNQFKNCLFFLDFDFLDSAIKFELEQSVKNQTKKFWNDTVSFLNGQTLEYSNVDLEDSLFLIRRIKLFDETEESVPVVKK